MTLRNLRIRPRPYDHETEGNIWVELPPQAWTALIAGAERSHFLAAQEAAVEVNRQVTEVQLARFNAEVRDAEVGS